MKHHAVVEWDGRGLNKGLNLKGATFQDAAMLLSGVRLLEAEIVDYLDSVPMEWEVIDDDETEDR